MNWVLLREEASVAETKEASVAENYGAALNELSREGKFKGEPPSIGLLTYIDTSLARPYLKPECRLVVPDSGVEAEQALNEAVAAGRIRTNQDGLLLAKDVRCEFLAITGTGKDRGRGSQRHFDAEAIERLAAHIRNNPKPPDALTTLCERYRDNPDTLREKLQLPAMSKDAFLAFVRCAIEVADNWLRNRSGERDTPKEWVLPPGELERQSRNLATWPVRRGRPRGRKGKN